ncbi:MAG: hypothetical protein II932_07960 [Treponema sp.]|nr:hypothetical protein [Treponema sp.]
MYFAQLYQMNLSARGLDLFGSTLVKIPAPSFIVFYNGDRELPDVSEQRLSDAFEPAGCALGFEWTAKVINIGGNHSLQSWQAGDCPEYAGPELSCCRHS